jgi:mannose-6-phosphate isomerase
MKKVLKPWGYELIWAETENYISKMIHINAGHRLSKQFHNIKEESLYVIRGTLCNYDENGTIHRFTPGQSLHIVPKQIHRFAAIESDVDVIEVSTPFLEDVIRLDDDYKR